MVHHQDEPIADWVCLPLHFVSKLARESGTTVVQVGEGSDELLHGYDHYMTAARLEQRLGRALSRVPRPLGVAASAGLTAVTDRAGRGRNSAAFVASAVRGRVPFWGGAICFQGPVKDRVLVANGGRPDAYAVVDRIWRQAEREAPAADYLQKMTYLELKQRLAEMLLMRVDKMTMATSIEARVPFLDHDLVEFALALPPSAKVRDGVGKYLLKKGVAPIVGHDVAYRTKQGFTAPMREWFRGETGLQAREVIRRSSLAERGLLDYEQVERLWRAHRGGRGDWSFQLWNLYNVSAWHDHWVAGRRSG
jgi:asparagine synthase (glutamine-hydrolysing)